MSVEDDLDFSALDAAWPRAVGLMFDERDAYELVTTMAGERAAMLKRDLHSGHVERAARTALELAGQAHLIRDGGLGPPPDGAVLWELEGALDAALGLPHQRLLADVRGNLAAAVGFAATVDVRVEGHAVDDLGLAVYGAAAIDLRLSDACELLSERAILVAAALIAVLVDDSPPTTDHH